MTTSEQITRRRTVGIRSMQRIYNYGSSLQAYSLRRLVESIDQTADVTFLDFTPGPVLVGGSEPSRFDRTSAGRIAQKVVEYGRGGGRTIDKLRFFEHKRTYGRRYFPALGIAPTRSTGGAVDVEIIGSDEVFNCVQSNLNVGYSRDLFGRASGPAHLISYAASFGNTTLAKLRASGVAETVAEDLARFASLSVRDSNSADIVSELLGTRPQVHVDPVLAHDLMAHESAIPTARLYERPYLIVYGYSGRLSASENSALQAYARRRGARILTFGGVQACGDEFIEASPFELLAYFRDAEAVITDTFHGTIFSLITGTPFATIVRKSVGTGYGNEEKLTYLLDLVGAMDRRVHSPATLTDSLDRPLDLAAVNRVLTAERARTRDYLTRAIVGDNP